MNTPRFNVVRARMVCAVCSGLLLAGCVAEISRDDTARASATLSVSPEPTQQSPVEPLHPAKHLPVTPANEDRSVPGDDNGEPHPAPWLHREDESGEPHPAPWTERDTTSDPASSPPK